MNMKQFITLIIVCLVLFSCRSSNQTSFGNLILLDANQDKDKIDLLITDIADVFYIPLKYGAENVMVGTSSVRRNIFVYNDTIFLGDGPYQSPKLVTYDLNGEPIQVFGSYGRGPREYMSLQGFIVDTLANEVIIFDLQQRKFVVFSTSGVFKRERLLEQSYQTAYMAIENINERYMLAYMDNSQTMSDNDVYMSDGQIFMEKGKLVTQGKLFTLYDKQTLSEVDFLDFEYEKPSRLQVFTIFLNLTTTKDGVYITSARTDTIYFIDREPRLIPKFVDVTKYSDPNHEARLFPSAESDQYIFFSTALENNFDNQNLRRFFAYDKKMHKLLRIKTGLPEQGPANTQEAIVNNKIAFSQGTLTLNHNYVAAILSAEYLLEHYDTLPADLKTITANIREDDNPVLMLMKLK